MNSLLLLAALSTNTATTAPPETVYVERVVIERPVNPQAAPPALGSHTDGVKYVISALMVGAGAYLIVHGTQNPSRHLVVDGNFIRVEESTSVGVYVGSGLIGLGILTLALP